MSAAEFEVARVVARARADFIPTVGNFVRETVIKLAMPVSDAGKLAALTEEACAGIIRWLEDGAFRAVVLRRPHQVAVEIADEGDGAGFRRQAEGIPSLLKAVMDKRFAERLVFSIMGDRITGVEIVKNLPLWDVVSETSIPPLTGRAPSAHPPELRRMRPDEGVALARLVYRCYGYDYARDAVYSPETMRHYLSSGLVVSYVAVTSDGEIVGHVALERDRADAPVAEMGMAFVDPRYRGQKLLERLSEFVAVHARQAGLAGLFAEAVTSHTYSQRSALSLGFRETGVMLGLIPSSGHPGTGLTAAGRRSAIFMYRSFGRRPDTVVFPPVSHHRIVRRIYENAGIPRRVDEKGEAFPSPSSTSQLKVDVQANAGRALIAVTGYGAGLKRLLSMSLDALCGHRIDCVYLDIPLESPAARLASDDAGPLGFSFCGVIPETASGDMLRLQYLNKVELCPDDRHTASDFGRELMDYVVGGAARPNAGCSHHGR